MRAQIRRWHLCLLAVFLFTSASLASAQGNNGRGKCMEPFGISFYQVKPGYEDEWLDLYMEWHYPLMEYALEQPADGDIFGSSWTTHILKDNIRPQPTYPAPNNDPAGPGRLAPGLAQEFWPSRWDENFYKPWVLVGGDEAAKVWLLRPTSEDPSDWNYDSAVIFDINDHYGANTSQSFSAPPPAACHRRLQYALNSASSSSMFTP